MKAEGSLQCSQESATGPFSELDESTSQLPSCILNSLYYYTPIFN
jgi:hypothetical protein